MNAALVKAMLHDPVLLLELLSVIFTGVYLARLLLRPVRTQPEQSARECVPALIDCVSLHSAVLPDRLQPVRSAQVAAPLFDVGALVSTHKRSLRRQRRHALLALQ